MSAPRLTDRGYGVDPSGNPLDRFGLSRPVWLLGWVSFFTDVAGEIIYPLLPLFLTQTLGASAMSIGVIEGVAEAANSVLKVVSGWLADRFGALKRLVLAGYGLSSLVRPVIAVVGSWPQVLFIRFGDRLGKGVRTSPRDAMLASYAPPELRGRVYGFHQAMDHAGAVIGPLIASAYLYYHPQAYRALFAWTLLPGIIVILVILRLPRGSRPAKAAAAQAAGARAPAGRARLTGSFYRAMVVITLFSLGNSTDAFLLLRLNTIGVAAVWIPLLWSAIHVVKMSSSVVGGALSDRLGRRMMIGVGYLWYAAIYFAFGWFTSLTVTIVVFLAYGIYFGLTEGVEKAWVADLAPREARGMAFGIYNGAIGFGALAASLLFGAIWTEISPRAAFMTGAGLALVASVLLAVLFERRRA